MDLLHFFSLPLTLLPEELSARESSLTFIIGAALFLSFLLIAFAKLLKADIFWTLLVSNVRTVSLPTYLKESYPLNKGGSALLLVNYLFAFSTVIYMMLGSAEVNSYEEWLSVGLVPVALLLWPLLSMTVVGMITGERQVFAEALAMKIVGTQLLGVIFFVVALITALYSIDSLIYLQVIFGVFIGESVVRFYKSIRSVYLRGVSWYYIILYFCTLEILPLFVAYYFVLKDFNW